MVERTLVRQVAVPTRAGDPVPRIQALRLDRNVVKRPYLEHR